MHITALTLQSDGTRYLEVGKAIDLSLAQKRLFQRVDIIFLQLLVDIDDMLQLLQEPLINLCQFMNLVDIILRHMHGL